MTTHFIHQQQPTKSYYRFLPRVQATLVMLAHTKNMHGNEKKSSVKRESEIDEVNK